MINIRISIYSLLTSYIFSSFTFQFFCHTPNNSNVYYGDKINVVVREAVIDSYNSGGWSDIICKAEVYILNEDNQALLTCINDSSHYTIYIEGCGPDFNADGVIDLLDFQIFQEVFNAQISTQVSKKVNE